MFPLDTLTRSSSRRQTDRRSLRCHVIPRLIVLTVAWCTVPATVTVTHTIHARFVQLTETCVDLNDSDICRQVQPRVLSTQHAHNQQQQQQQQHYQRRASHLIFISLQPPDRLLHNISILYNNTTVNHLTKLYLKCVRHFEWHLMKANQLKSAKMLWLQKYKASVDIRLRPRCRWFCSIGTIM